MFTSYSATRVTSSGMLISVSDAVYFESVQRLNSLLPGQNVDQPTGVRSLVSFQINRTVHVYVRVNLWEHILLTAVMKKKITLKSMTTKFPIH
jgi:hypothetical protein